MASLIPVIRADKNGKLVTKHVRSEPALKSSKGQPIPSPTSASETKAKFASGIKLTTRQKNTELINTSGADADPILISRLGSAQKQSKVLVFRVSDVQGYSVLAVTSKDNAMHLINKGYNDGASAEQFLKSNGLSHLLEDNTMLMEEALRREIGFSKFASFLSETKGEQHSPELLIDAAEANSIEVLRTMSFNDGTSNSMVFRHILNDSISLADIKNVGATNIKQSGSSDEILLTLSGIHKGTVKNVTADQVKEITRSIREDEGAFDSKYLDWALKMSRERGAEYVTNLNSIVFSQQVYNHLTKSVVGGPSRDRIVAYADEFSKYGKRTTLRELCALERTGISASIGSQLLAKGHSIEQIAEIHKEKITVSVAEGWL